MTKFDARAELIALGRFLAVPARSLQPVPTDPHWVLRALFFAALALLANAVIGFGLLIPLADRVGIDSKLPDAFQIGFALLAVMLAPVLEELIFRAGLRQAGYTLFVGPALIALIAVPGRRLTLIVVAVLAGLALLVWVFYRIVIFRRHGARFTAGRLFIAHYHWVFWAYANAFALAHIGNYAWGGPRGALVVLLVAPQFIIGVVAGYLRIRDGLRASVLLHFAGNVAAVGISALYS